MRIKKLLATLTLVVLVTALQSQNVIYVNSNAWGDNDGSSWGNAYVDLSEAIQAAQSGDQVWVAAGVYYPTMQPNYPVGAPEPEFNHFTLKKGVSVLGGFQGNETSVDQRNIEANLTILSGDIDQNDNIEPEGYVSDVSRIVGRNSLKLFYFPPGMDIDSTAVLDGFILTGAYADNDVFPYMGGAAMLSRDASPKVANCTFIGNYARHSGGAIWVENSTMIIENCTFIGNKAESHGGAVCLVNAGAMLRKSTFSGNEGRYGGALNIQASDKITTIDNCVFENNNAVGTNANGGGIDISTAVVRIKNSSFDGNTAVARGGGIAIHGVANVDIINSEILSNVAGTYGGGIGALTGSSANRMNVRLVNARIQGNDAAGGRGGGISYRQGVDGTMVNVLLAGNRSSQQGSAIDVTAGSKPVVINTTIADNVANVGGTHIAAIRVQDNGSTIDLNNSILVHTGADFSYTNASAINMRFTRYVDSNSELIAQSVGRITSHPRFIDAVGDENLHTGGNYRLWGNSPVNNKGSNTFLPRDIFDLDGDGDATEPIPVDLDGRPRVFAGVVDLGCYEQQFETVSGNMVSLHDGQQLRMGDGVPLNDTDFTIEFWIKPGTDFPDDSWFNICGVEGNAHTRNRPPSMWLFQYDRIHYGYGDGTNWVSGDTQKAVRIGQWNHIAMTFNKTTRTMTMYANGELLEQLTGGGDVVATPLKMIANTQTLRASLDEFRVWKEERTHEQLIENMNRTLSGNEPNLVLYYPFDEVTGEGIVEDLAGNNNGELIGNAMLLNSNAILTPILKPVTNVGIDNFTVSWFPVPNASGYYIDVATDEAFQNMVINREPATGSASHTVSGLSRGTIYYYKVSVKTNNDEWGSQYGHTATKLNPPGNAFAFDGETYIDATHVCKYPFEQGTSIEVWVNKTGVLAPLQAVWACNTAEGDNNFILFYRESNNSIYIGQYNPETNQHVNLFNNGSIPIPDGWHHVAVTIDEDLLLRIYVDGELKGEGMALNEPFPYRSTLSIGQEFDGAATSDYFLGEMDEFRVWNRALAQEEIQERLNSTLQGDEEGLVAYYNFDLQTGEVVIDNANVFDGRVIGNPIWIPSTILNHDFKVFASSQTFNGFNLNWEAVSEATSYTIQIATDTQFNNIVSTSTPQSGLEYTALGLEAGTRYYFRVLANNGKTSIINYTATLMQTPGNAMTFNGVDDWVEANQVANLDFGKTATIESWVWVDPTESRGMFWAINSSTGGNRYLFSYENGRGYNVYRQDGRRRIISDFRTRGTWVHVAASIDADNGTKLYVNGVYEGSIDGAGTYPFINGDQLSFGQEFDGLVTSDFFRGAIDEVRIWNTIRTEEEILGYMHKKINPENYPDLMAYFDFDQTEGQFVSERVRGLDGTIMNNPQWIESNAVITPLVYAVEGVTPFAATIKWHNIEEVTDYKLELAVDRNFQDIVQTVATTAGETEYRFTNLIPGTEYYARVASYSHRWSTWSLGERFITLLVPPGNALAFDGIDGIVEAGQVMESDWGAMTLESWVKLAPPELQSNASPRILSNYVRGNNLGRGAGIVTNANGNLRFEYRDQDVTYITLTSQAVIADDNWRHVAAVFDGSTVKLYIDGILESERDVTPGSVIRQSNIPFSFGNQDYGDLAHPLNGTLDEIRIWNVARTAEQISEFAHKPLTGIETGLVAYYNVDLAEGTTFKDEAGNFDATMSGGVTWAESKALITPFAREATDISETGFTAHWTEIPNAGKYFLRVATDPMLTQLVEGWENVEVGNVITFEVSGLTEHTSYYYGVMSETDRLSAWSPASPRVKTTGGLSGQLAIDLEGADNYIDLSAHISRIAGRSAGAITGWFKGTDNGVIYQMGGADTGSDYVRIAVGHIVSGMNDESFWFYIRRDNELVFSMGVREGEDKFLDNNWHHFAIITGDGNNRILIDGIEREVHYWQEAGNGLSQEFSSITDPSFIRIGQNRSLQVNELAIYNNPLTNEEVLERAHRPLLGNEMGLVLYYDFNEVSDDVVIDASGKGRNANIVGDVSYERSHVLNTPFLKEPASGVTVADLSWTPITNAEYYVIDIATDDRFTEKITDSQVTTTASYHIENLSRHQKYYYRVRAKVNGEWSEWSATGDFYTIPGNSMVFDRSLRQYIRIDGVANYGSDQATIECWVKPEDYGGSGRYAIWAHNNAVDNTNQYVLVYEPTTMKLLLWTMNEDGSRLSIELPGEHDLMGKWNHIAASIIKNGQSVIYLNGKSIFEFTHFLPPIVSGFHFSIAQEWDNNYADSDHFHGEIDEFRVWDLALTEQQIRENMNVSKPAWASDHFIAHYTFDEIHDNVWIRDQARDNHGRLFGLPTATIRPGSGNDEDPNNYILHPDVYTGLPVLTSSEGVIVPITLEPTDITSGSFVININNIPSAESFEVVIAHDPTFVPPLALHQNVGKTTAFNADGLCPGVEYFYRVRAIYDSNTISAWSVIENATTVAQNAVISNFTATQGDYSQNLRLSWDCSNDYLITDFEISRRIKGTDAFEPIAVVPNDGSLMQYMDETALPGTYYEYSIQGLSYCFNNDTEVVISNVGYNIPRLTASKEINEETQQTYIRLDWEYHPAFCNNVEIRRIDTESGITQTFQEVADSLVYRDTDASLCVTYSYQLIAKTAGYGDVNSRAVSFTLEQDIFTAIDTLDASKAYFDNRIILNWVSGSQNVISEYQISRRRYESGNNWQVVAIIDRGTTQSWIDDDAVAGILYEYSIVGMANCGSNILYTDVAYSVGMRQPEGVLSGQVNYAGGNPVRDVKITATYNDPAIVKGHALNFSGNDSLVITRRNDFVFNGFTLEMYVKPSSLNPYFSLFENSNMMLEYDGAGNLMAQCGSAVTQYNITTNTLNAWENNAWNHVAVSAGNGEIKLFVNGEMVGSGSGNLLAELAETSVVGREYSGLMDELRIWRRALADDIIKRNHTLVLGRDEDFLICALRFDEGLGQYAFDHSRTEGESNKTHAAIYGAQWSQDIPGVAKLSPGAFTEPNGSYQVNGLRFRANGQTYRATPSLGVHAFDPSSRTMLISENSLIHGNQDFTDISSFVVTGNVKYLGADFPVEGVMIAVDGQIAVNVEGQPIVTDQFGNFTIEVPIGDHFISVQKMGHTFSQGYFPPKDENGEITFFNFNDNLSGIQFIDSTFITVAGRIVGGTVEGEKPIGLGLSNNNIGVGSFTIKAAKGYAIAEEESGAGQDAAPVYEITVNTDPETGEYEIRLFPEVYEFVGQIGNQQYVFNSIDDLSLIDLSGMMTLTTDTAVTETGEELFFDYHVKRNWIYRSVPKIEVTALDGSPHFYDHTITAEDEELNPVEVGLLTENGEHVLGYPVFTKGVWYNALISVFEEYVNPDNGAIDQVPVNDGTLTAINTCAAYPAPVEYEIENGLVEYQFIGGFPNPAVNTLNPHLSYTKTFEIHAATGENGSMQSQWPENGPFRAYVFGGIPTGNNFVTQGPDLVDFILRDPAGSNSRAYFESGFTISNTVSNSFSNSLAQSMGVEIDLGWEVTTFVGLGAGIISTNEQIANVETGVSYESEWEEGNTFTTTTTINKSYSTSDDPAYVGKQGDLFFGHSTNISYGVSNYVKLLPVGTGENGSELDVNVNGFTIGQKKGINFGIQYNTDFIYSLNHIENYLIPDLEMMYEYHMNNDDPEEADFYMQQADIWRSVLAENEYQKYIAINTIHEDDKNISFDAGAVYEESITTEVTETRTSSFSFSIDHSVASEVGLSVMGVGTTWSFESSVGAASSNETEDSETTTTTVGFELADGDQGDYFSIDVLKCHFGNGPIFVTKGGQSSCPYEDGVKVEYANYLDREDYESGFIDGYDLSFPTMRIEVPAISAENAIISGVPDNLPAEFTIYLSNLSEVNADSWYTLTMDVASNPYGALVSMDGASISNGVNVMIPGGSTITKTLRMFKGQSGINSYENINIILHSMCQFDPTDDLENIADTVTISAHFVPVCTNVAITNPNNNWLVNTSSNNQLPVTIGDYNTQHGTFERIAFQYRSQAASNWSTAMMFFKYEDDFNAYDGAKTLIQNDNVIQYNWNVAALQDRNYLIRAVSMCSDGSVTPSEPLAGVIDRQRPQVFGTPSPANGILSPGDDVMVTFNEPIEEGLVTYYNFVVEGVLNGATLHHGTSAELNGINDFILTPDGINLAGSSYTFEFWMQKPEASQGTILSFGNENQGTFSWNFTADEVVITINDQVFSVLNPVNDENWHHWAMTWSNATENLALYADDQLVFEQTAPALTGTGSLYFGKRNYTDDNYFNVRLHDIRVWRKALAYSEVIGQMNNTLTGNEMGLLGYWPVDEGKGNLLTDKARSRHATLAGNWSIQPGGNAYTFNGIDQSLIVNTSAIPVSREMDLTIEMWFNAGPQAGNAYLLSNGADDTDFSPAGKTMNVYLNDNGNIVVESNGVTIVSPQTYLDNAWHHLAFVVNRRGYATLFVDGGQVAQVTAPQIGAFESAFAYIGARGYLDNSSQHVLDGFFNGSIDEVRIWNTARRQKQIEMYAYHRLDGSETGLKAYFPFEKYEEVMGILMSVPTLDDQSIDPDSSTGVSHCGTLTAVGSTHYTTATPAILRKRAKSAVNFDFVINNDRIIITPNEELANIERCILEFTVKNIEDKNGNRLASPVTWTAFVEQNLVRWGQDEFTFNKELDEPLTFSNTIVNLGGTHQSFNLSNLPSWLSASPTNGTLNPNSQITVQFTVAEGVNIGRYSEEIFLQSNSGYNEKLLLNLNVYRQAPDWTVDENQFSQSMNVIGKLRIKGVFSSDENDMIGVFAGNECRGVAQLEYKANYDDYFLFLVVYGNETNEELTYKVWDASEGKIFSDVSPSILFEPNAFHGTIAEPVIFDVSGLQDNTLVFNAGWNWVSFNLEMVNPSVQNVFSNMMLSTGDLISHSEWYSTYSGTSNSWLGTLNDLEIAKLYRVFSAEGGELTYLGSEVLSADYPIELASGWSRIGFVPNVNLTVNQALSGFEPQTGDVIKGQHQFAMWDGFEWIGSLKTMRPARGYMYHSLAHENVTFVYPESGMKDGEQIDDAGTEKEGETFTFTTRYEHSMSMIARVVGLQPHADDVIVAIVNGSIRASAGVSDMKGYEGYVFMTLAGETDDHNQPVEFRLIRGNETFMLDAAITFTVNAIEGHLGAPVLLVAEQATNVDGFDNLNVGVRLYPNPFTHHTDILFHSPGQDEVDVSVVNAQGALVAKFTSLATSDGSHRVRWNGENLHGSKVMPGVYFIKIKTSEFSKVLPVVKSE